MGLLFFRSSSSFATKCAKISKAIIVLNYLLSICLSLTGLLEVPEIPKAIIIFLVLTDYSMSGLCGFNKWELSWWNQRSLECLCGVC